ncbi:MAG: hypothetical protein CMP24_02380 [Rickettsiales bacterium]|nr:hypothetical protein [Rickettsiales bacterium]|tara:strand:+ start:568 stop:1287 length:720 start_codon:yes stop_codon:yes gene_type:complete
MVDIDKLRKKIDSIDNDILNLLNKRSVIATKIGKIKKKNGKSTNYYRPERQINILRRLIKTKKNTLEIPFIINLWKIIFFFQTKLQGKIKYIVPKNFSNTDISLIINYLGQEVKFEFKNNIETAFNDTLKNMNSLLFLPYPSENKNCKWWTDVKVNSLFVIASVPIILGKNQKPKLVILSQNKPVLKNNNNFLYLANSHVKQKKIKLISKFKKKYLFETKQALSDNNFSLLGAYSNIQK